MAEIIKKHDFTLYEYFWTDYVGHKGTLKEKKEVIQTLNAFLKALLKNLDLRKNTVIIASDHGNIEEHSSRKHTANKVPTLVFSKKKRVLDLFMKEVKDLTDITRCIVENSSPNPFS